MLDVGGDVMEVAPQYDATTNTAQVAAACLAIAQDNVDSVPNGNPEAAFGHDRCHLP